MFKRRIASWGVVTVLFVAAVLTTVTLMERTGGIPPAAASAPPGPASADHPINTLRDFNDAMVELAKTVTPSVVTVFTEKVLKVRESPGSFDDFFGQFFGQPNQPPSGEREFHQRGLGSGVIVSPDISSRTIM